MYLNPVDAMNLCKGRAIVVELKSGREYSGTFVEMDLESNLTIEIEGKSVFLQGESINFLGTVA